MYLRVLDFLVEQRLYFERYFNTFLKKMHFLTELMSAIYQIIVYGSTSTQIIGTIYTISQIPHCLYYLYIINYSNYNLTFYRSLNKFGTTFVYRYK